MNQTVTIVEVSSLGQTAYVCIPRDWKNEPPPRMSTVLKKMGGMVDRFESIKILTRDAKMLSDESITQNAPKVF